MTVCEMYARYVSQKFGTATVIVFDGYKEEPTIKDATQCVEQVLLPKLLYTSLVT